MWCRNRVVGIVLAVLTLANLIVQCIIMTDLIRSIKCMSLNLGYMTFFNPTVYIDVPPPYLGFRGCFLGSKSNKRLESSWASFASLCVVEAGVHFFWLLGIWHKAYPLILVMLSLVAVSAFQSCSSASLFRYHYLVLTLNIQTDRAIRINSHMLSTGTVGDSSTFRYRPSGVLIIL